ncbi:hypothetical protein [Taibaiella koreensis]|uniref:hypothetical protein n=1 Tax=Taibaiella koreensis TaxID=1268548 RepID=UPI000E59ABDA|nr:hypothetical protein [Taibaiella koreensis]
MDLKIEISGIDFVFDGHSFYHKRRFGHSVEFGALLKLNQETQEWITAISEQLREERTDMTVTWKGEQLAAASALFQCSYVLHETEPRLLLTCRRNEFEAYKPGPFVPRKRVLKGKNMLELFRKYFLQLVAIEDHIEAALQKVKFPDNEKTNLIQFGYTDYEMMQKVLNWYNTQVALQDTLTVSGSAETLRFDLVWAQPGKYISLGYNESRKLDDHIASSYKEDIRIGYGDRTLPIIYKSGIVPQNAQYILNRGGYTREEWQPWSTINVPAFYKGRFVYEVIDTFKDARVGNLGWETRITTLARQEELDVPAQEFGAWSGMGTVKKRSATDCWMEVELADFENGANLLDVRVTTAYSGHHGNAGFHLVPEMNTEVLVHKSCNWKEPVLLLSNVRSEAAAGKAPFWKLEDASQWEFTSLSVSLNDVTTTASKNIVMQTKEIKATAEDSIAMQSKEITTTAEESITMKTKAVTAKMNNSEMDIS